MRLLLPRGVVAVAVVAPPLHLAPLLEKNHVEHLLLLRMLRNAPSWTMLVEEPTPFRVL